MLKLKLLITWVTTIVNPVNLLWITFGHNNQLLIKIKVIQANSQQITNDVRDFVDNF